MTLSNACNFRLTSRCFPAVAIVLIVSTAVLLAFAPGCKRSKTGSVLDGTPTGAANPATACPKALPAVFYGTWVGTGYDGKDSGKLVIDANQIKWALGSPAEGFSIGCAAVTVEEDGNLSFNPDMWYFSGSFGREFTVTPNVKISKSSDSELLIKIGAFRAEVGGPDAGGAYEAIDPQQHTLFATP